MIEKEKIRDFIFTHFKESDEDIPLHKPYFLGNESEYLENILDSRVVSTVGDYVNKLEDSFSDYVGAKFAVAVNSGTSALHLAMLSLNIDETCEVITQSVSFVATSNAIMYCGASPVFLDVDLATMGLCPKELEFFLKNHTQLKNGVRINTKTQKRIGAIVPVHVLGHSCLIEDLVLISERYNVPILEDAAAALGSFYKGQHTGTFGRIGVFSFNGNKIVTAGGGGMVITDDETIYERLMHLSTTSKVLSNKVGYIHDELGYNYRMPNLNAGLALAQMENLKELLVRKKQVFELYNDFCEFNSIGLVKEPSNAVSNYWLNAILVKGENERDEFISFLKNHQIDARPLWPLINTLSYFSEYYCGNLSNSISLFNKLVLLPSF